MSRHKTQYPSTKERGTFPVMEIIPTLPSFSTPAMREGGMATHLHFRCLIRLPRACSSSREALRDIAARDIGHRPCSRAALAADRRASRLTCLSRRDQRHWRRLARAEGGARPTRPATCGGPRRLWGRNQPPRPTGTAAAAASGHGRAPATAGNSE